MNNKNRVLAVITARGGSKGLPRKNILSLAGRPLIGWTIAAARHAHCVGRVVVSTDDKEIEQVALAEGAEVPFVRPNDLATDQAKSIDVFRHAIEQCPGFEYAILLQPTSPLRTHADIDGAFAQMQASRAPACVSVCEVEESPWLMYRQEKDGCLQRLLPEPATGTRRQDFPPVCRLNGAIYLVRTEWFIATGGFLGPGTVGYFMPSERSIDIDTQADFDSAEMKLSFRTSL